MRKKFKVLNIFKWLYPGLRIKRWLFLCIWGVSVSLFGGWHLGLEEVKNVLVLKYLAMGIVFLGVLFLIIAIFKLITSLLDLFIPNRERHLVELVYKKRLLERGPNIVVIGGGTGLSTLLRGLKEYTSNLTAVVTVADSGGSTGRLRKEFDIIAPGDIRHCLVALADREKLMSELFDFRFKTGEGLVGHNFGNLFITVMTKITGDFEKAIRESSRVLAVRGEVLPSTLSRVTLVARYKDGGITEGEDLIPQKDRFIDKVYLKPHDNFSNIPAFPDAVRAIREAEAIVLGPGSLYTSILPNLVIKDIADAIVSSNAIKIYVCNVMSQMGETQGYTVSDHIKSIIAHSHPKILTYCLANNGLVPEALLSKYKEEASYPIILDKENVKEMGYKLIEKDIISTADYVRHDPSKLARIIIGLISRPALFN